MDSVNADTLPPVMASRRLILTSPMSTSAIIVDARNTYMKTLNDRIDEYMQRKGLDRITAIEALLTFALDTIDGRRKGGKAVGNRPQQGKHLERARKVRAK